ncbi:hypothetical protein L207DRAFT_574076 [Hyaloscypha variabilis F]|uniref:FAR-17a/AIG1-like protein n=1 Tax=Hyaloscypha variabilis (strain UAMH 11265 / GT02V1 / F) TaxID=1149755 RepID=A0A2J6QTV2_HYAVF|nr:hypothetical protein L207DRAFT_574076 [Hyaloscypha variabilis F]
MSSSTALLPKDRKKDDHPIFLRVCHSPWITIGQKALVGLRGLIAAYLFVAFLAVIKYELERNKSGLITIFKFSNITSFLQLLYHNIAATYTVMHLYYPHHGSQARNWKTRVQKFLSPPRQHSSTQNGTWFSIFYTASNTFPLVSAAIHWFITVPTKHATIPGDHTFGHGWFTTFFVLHKYAIIAVIAIFEVFFLSSIKRQEPIGAHLAGLSFLSVLYIGWTYIGYVVADKYVWWFLDHRQVGWEYVVSSWFAFVVLVKIGFFVLYGIHGLREWLTKKGENKNRGYQQLPQ